MSCFRFHYEMSKIYSVSAAWRLRDHANILYSLFPTSQLLVQQDHIVWISNEPLGTGEMSLRIATVLPKSELENAVHGKRNHLITSITLKEGFVIGESIQASAALGANSQMLFGRFEVALGAFNRTVASYVNSPSA